MKKNLIRAVSAAAALTALGAPMLANAESNVQSGTGALTATARLDFRVTVPKVLFLQVGTGASLGTNTTVNLIDFTVPAANVGDGTAIGATAASGDLGNGAGDTLSYAQIATTPAVLTSATPLAAPALADGATTSTTVPAVGKIVNRDAKWTFSFLNTALVAPGVYGGVNANNSRVTYTASMP